MMKTVINMLLAALLALASCVVSATPDTHLAVMEIAAAQLDAAKPAIADLDFVAENRAAQPPPASFEQLARVSEPYPFTRDPGCGSWSWFSREGGYIAPNASCGPPLGFWASLQSSIIPEFARGSSTPTYTRAGASTAYQTDFEGKLNLLPANVPRLQGARYVRSILPSANSDLTTGWTKLNANVTTGVADPLGGTKAVTLTATAGGFAWYLGISNAGASFVNSMWVRRNTGSSSVVLFTPSGLVGVTIPISSTWQRFATNVGAGAGGVNYVGIQTLASGESVDVAFVMPEDVTGQTNQNPSEYVSVGVLSAPYHGAGVDGVKYFSTLNGNTVASNVVTEATGAPINSSTAKFGVLTGVAGDYFSTPDSAAASITGDIDIRVSFVANAYSGTQMLVSKLVTAGQYSYDFYLSGGTLTLRTSADGTVLRTAASTAAITTVFSAGTRNDVKVTRSASTGTVTFSTSTDGQITWTQLGNTVSTTAEGIKDGTDAIGVGNTSGGSSNPLNGRIYRTQIYNGINGTLAVDFNPNDSTTAQTWTSSTTGEVWTTNGNARAYGNTHATYGIPAQWDASGPLGYLAEGSAQNICLQSQDFTTTWAVSAAADMNAPTADQYVAPSGATTMDKLSTKATNSTHYMKQAVTWTNVVWTVSGFLRYVNSNYVAIVTTDGTTTRAASFNLSNGTAGAVSNATSTIKATALAGVYYVTMTGSTAQAAAAGEIRVSMNGATDSASALSWNAAGTELVGAWQFDAVIGSFATSPIPTTTVAVTRAADVLTYALAGNIDATVGTGYAEIATTWTGTSALRADIISSASGAPLYIESSAGKLSMNDGAARLGNVFTGSATVQKVASAWGGSAGKTYIAGTPSSALTFDGDMSMTTALHIGDNNGASQLNGTIRFVRLWLDMMSDAQIQVVEFNNAFMPGRVVWLNDHKLAANDERYLLRVGARR